MAFGGSEQISFYWLLNWPSRGTNRREAEQWRKKKGWLKILKGVNISLVLNGTGLVSLIFLRRTRTNILKCKVTSVLNKIDPYPWRNYFFLSADMIYDRVRMDKSCLWCVCDVYWPLR